MLPLQKQSLNLPYAFPVLTRLLPISPDIKHIQALTRQAALLEDAAHKQITSHFQEKHRISPHIRQPISSGIFPSHFFRELKKGLSAQDSPKRGLNSGSVSSEGTRHPHKAGTQGTGSSGAWHPSRKEAEV